MKTITVSVLALSLVAAAAFASVKTIKHSPALNVDEPIIIIVGEPIGQNGNAPLSPDEQAELRCLLDKDCCTIFHKKVAKK